MLSPPPSSCIFIAYMLGSIYFGLSFLLILLWSCSQGEPCKRLRKAGHFETPGNRENSKTSNTSASASASGAEFTMAAALARLGLLSVKQIRVQFCPFEKHVESTRTFLQAVSSEKVRSTNLNCSVIADVRHDGSEPCVDVLFGDGHRLLMRGAHLTAQEMLSAFASHIQARSSESEDKPDAGTGTKRR